MKAGEPRPRGPDPSIESLRGLLEGSLGKLCFVDVGAFGATSQEVFRPAVLPDSRVVGFEGDRAECERLNAAARGDREYFPHLVGDGREAVFRTCRSPWTSSLLEPDAALLSRYENLAELCEVVSRAPAVTVRLDDLDGLAEVDFLKLDIQGGTLAALQGAQRMLAGTLVVHAEVEFAPIYAGEPLFSECEAWLRARGFMFHHFHGMEGRRVRADGAVVGRSPSQVLWADAVFIPTFARLDALAPRAAHRLAWLLHCVYGAHDFAMLCLAVADRHAGSQVASAYRTVLARAGLES